MYTLVESLDVFINTTSDSDGIKFISQLIIQLDANDTLEGRTVECVHSFTTQTNVIGTYTISYTRGKMYQIDMMCEIKIHYYMLLDLALCRTAVYL